VLPQFEKIEKQSFLIFKTFQTLLGARYFKTEQLSFWKEVQIPNGF
jgi:hypothetical protein